MLTWAIYLLSQSPERRERVIKEAEEAVDRPGHDAEALIQTRAVVEEALRLSPPIIGITRTALRRTELAGHAIARGTMVIISIGCCGATLTVRSVPFPPRCGQACRAIRLSSLRRGAAHVHRRSVRAARGDPRTGDAHARLRPRLGARPVSVAGHQFHSAAARRPMHDGGAAPRATATGRRGITARQAASACASRCGQ